MSDDDTEVWVYHERQEALLCGQHALNNLVQAAAFTPDMLAEIAHQLDAMELNYMAQNSEGGTSSKDYLQRCAEGSGNVDSSGNFSIEVLRSALQTHYNMSLPNIRQEGVRDKTEVTDIDGFICHRDSHWFAIRKINGRYWNLNSTKDRPELISHFRLAAEIESLQNGGYSVFCVVETEKLPRPCTSSVELQRGKPEFWWKEADLVTGKSDAVTGATNPWRNVGEGMRLDGRPARKAASTSSSGGGGGSGSVDGMTEDEMMQMALAASLEQTHQQQHESSFSSESAHPRVALTPEPAPTEPGAVRIQVRLPDGNRVVRRFLSSESVGALYAFVEDRCPGGGKRLELRAGFPPADLNPKRGDAIGAAKLAGESVQSRYI